MYKSLKQEGATYCPPPTPNSASTDCDVDSDAVVERLTETSFLPMEQEDSVEQHNMSSHHHDDWKKKRTVLKVGAVFVILATLLGTAWELAARQNADDIENGDGGYQYFPASWNIVSISGGNSNFTSSGNIPVILEDMKQNAMDEALQSKGLEALERILRNGSTEKKNSDLIASQDGGIHIVMDPINQFPQNRRIQDFGINILWRLGHSSVDLKMAIVGEGGIETILNAMRESLNDINPDEDVLNGCCGALTTLVLAGDNVARLIQSGGGIPLLFETMQVFDWSDILLESALHTLGNLVSAGKGQSADLIMADDGVFEILDTMRRMDFIPGVQTYGLLVLGNMACYRHIRDELATILYPYESESGSGWKEVDREGDTFVVVTIRVALHAMRRHEYQILLQEWGCALLLNLAGTRPSGSDQEAKQIILSEGGLETVAKGTQFDSPDGKRNCVAAMERLSQ